MDYFSDADVQLAWEHAGNNYAKSGPVNEAFNRIRDGLSHLANLVGQQIEVPYHRVRNEKLDNRGRGGTKFSRYILQGFAPAGDNLGKTLFLKFELSFAYPEPTFKFELDVDNRGKYKASEELAANVREIKSAEALVPWSEVKGADWEELVLKISSYMEECTSKFRQVVMLQKAKRLSRTMEEKRGEAAVEYAKPQNTIFFGPPGTGKTWHMRNALLPTYIDEAAPVSRQEFLQQKVGDLSWWESISLALLLLDKPVRVTELREHEVILAKLSHSTAEKSDAILHGRLQYHTSPENPYVKAKVRRDPFIFEKLEDRNWKLDQEVLAEMAPRLLDLADALNNYQSRLEYRKRYQFVTFHQGYAYEDFVEGIKPVLSQEEEGEELRELGFELKRGHFFKVCLEALQLAGYQNFEECLEDDPETRAAKFAKAPPFALLIDEINRANVSQLFGELITLLEVDKRLGMPEEVVDLRLLYSRKLFGVPANLHLFGAMNTADRSVEALDTALRRRFSFVSMPANPALLAPGSLLGMLCERCGNESGLDRHSSIWKNAIGPLLDFLGGMETNPESVADTYDADPGTFEKNMAMDWFDGFRVDLMLEAINRRIEKLLDRDHCIGHSFFMGIAFANEPLSFLQRTFADNILPQLQEYFFGDFGKIGLVLGTAFVKRLSPIKAESGKAEARSYFANFDYDEDFVLDYYEKTSYQLQNPMELRLADFASIYE